MVTPSVGLVLDSCWVVFVLCWSGVGLMLGWCWIGVELYILVLITIGYDIAVLVLALFADPLT